MSKIYFHDSQAVLLQLTSGQYYFIDSLLSFANNAPVSLFNLSGLVLSQSYFKSCQLFEVNWIFPSNAELSCLSLLTDSEDRVEIWKSEARSYETSFWSAEWQFNTFWYSNFDLL